MRSRQLSPRAPPTGATRCLTTHEDRGHRRRRVHRRQSVPAPAGHRHAGLGRGRGGGRPLHRDRANLEGVDAVELVEGSILDAGLLDEVVAGADAVVHLAARPSVPRSLEDPMASHEANATGTIRVLEAARRHGSCPRHRGLVVLGLRRQPRPAQARGHGGHAGQPLRGQQAGRRVLRPGLRPLLRPAGAGLPVLQRLRAAAGGRPRLRRRGARPSSPPPCAAIPCPSTATAARPATSPTSARSPPCWPTPCGAR